MHKPLKALTLGNWKNKVVLITGSRIGIGRQTALEICKRGGKIILNSRDAQKLKEAQQSFKDQGYDVLAMAADISKPEECHKLVNFAKEECGRLDVLINNAGLASHSPLEDLNPEVFRAIIDVNLNGTVFMTQAAIPEIKKSGGSILFIGSLAGVQGIGGYAPYSASKMSLKAIYESLRIELKDSGIHLGLAYLGFTENDPQKRFLNSKGELVKLPDRSNIKQMPVAKVAQKIADMIEQRKPRMVLSGMGKFMHFINRLSPGIISRILRKSYWKEHQK